MSSWNDINFISTTKKKNNNNNNNKETVTSDAKKSCQSYAS